MMGVSSQIMKIVAYVTEKDVPIAVGTRCTHCCAHPLLKRALNSLAFDIVIFKNKSSELEVFRLSILRYAGVLCHEPIAAPACRLEY